VPDAVNVEGGVIEEDVRPFIALVEKLGAVFTGLAGGAPEGLTIEVRGELAAFDVKVLELAALKGVFDGIVDEQVSYVNAPLLAAERGVQVGLVVDGDSPDHRNLVTVRGALADGRHVSVSATLSGPKDVEKLVEVDGFDVDLAPAEHMAFLRYHDKPGVVGTVGRILGEHDINIAGMQVSRSSLGGHALIALTVDSAIPAHVVTEIVEGIGAHDGRTIDL
jgi:D-3-phosphoglycerate dehydrogenase